MNDTILCGENRKKQATIFAVEKRELLYILSVCVLALVIQRAMRMSRIVICGLSSSTIVFLVILQTARFKKKVMNNTGNCVQGQELSDYVPQEFIAHLGSSIRTMLYDKSCRR